MLTTSWTNRLESLRAIQHFSKSLPHLPQHFLDHVSHLIDLYQALDSHESVMEQRDLTDNTYHTNGRYQRDRDRLLALREKLQAYINKSTCNSA